tara:strand:+ start:69 stop:470 length:402 start_codon:yes stop_codon:yes gene_type:complete
MTDLTNRRVEDAAADWMKAKSAETKANKERIAAEGEILGFISAKTEGGTTHQAGQFKITLTGKLTRKVDWGILDGLNIPAKLLPVKTKQELDVKGVKYLEDNEPDTYKTLCKALTIAPSKTSVSVVITETEES